MAVMKRKVGGSSLFSLSCGCRDSSSASVSDSFTHSRRNKARTSFAESLPLSFTTSSPFQWVNTSSEQPEYILNSPATPTFSDLLRQLGDLERSLENWVPMLPPAVAPSSVPAHRKGRSSGKVRESVAVVKETADPLGDFRMSMLQMIVENEIVGGEELRELLGWFLDLNPPLYHELILRAFSEIWDDVFSGLERTPDLLRRHWAEPLVISRGNQVL